MYNLCINIYIYKYTCIYIYTYIYMDLCTYYALALEVPNTIFLTGWLWTTIFQNKGLSSFKRNPTICSMLATTHPGLHPFSLEKVQLSSSEHFPPGPKKTLGLGLGGLFFGFSKSSFVSAFAMIFLWVLQVRWSTSPKFNMKPENDGFPRPESPFPRGYSQVPC